MFTQLSLFDAAAASDAPVAAGFVHVAPRCSAAANQTDPAQCCQQAQAAELAQRQQPAGVGKSTVAAVAQDRRSDEIRPVGELAQLVLARYDLLARRRQEMDRRRREQPRKSIRVLSPQPLLCR